jgi:hypothetical protein
MAFVLKESQHPGIWILLYDGPVDLATRMEAFDEGRKVIKEQSVTGALIDFRESEFRCSIEEAYVLIAEKVSSALFLDIKTALLFHEVPNEGEFEAMIAENRGIEVRAFADEQTAYDWLREG